MSAEDEALARRLQSAEFQASRPVASARSGSSQTGQERQPDLPRGGSTARFSLELGHSATVKLHHVATNRQIGEIVYAHYIDTNVMAFELSSSRGRFLKAKATGGLDYSQGLDELAKFRVESAAGGNLIFLSVTQHEHSVNKAGGTGWYLGLSSEGQLYCDGGKDALSQWALISARGSAPPPPPVAVTAALTPAPVRSAQSPPPASDVFPGADAGKEELLRFFSTSQGGAFLNQPPYNAARALHQQGHLAKILHRPDWPLLAHSFVDCSVPIPYDETRALQTSFQAVKSFFDQGFLVVPQAVSAQRLYNAQKVVNYWTYRHLARPGSSGTVKGKHCTAELGGDLAHDPDLLQLYADSVFPHLLQRLLGTDEVEVVKACRVLQVYPCLDVSEDNPALLGDRWNIEGFTKEGGHSPYNVLVGIALTDTAFSDMGNFCVHPGSHMALMEQFREQTERRHTLFSDDPKEVHKPDLGEPVQLLLHAGDAFMVTQRLATLLALNTSNQVSAFVFFRVSHIDHVAFKDAALHALWVEYKHAPHYMENEVDPADKGWVVDTAVAVPAPDEFVSQLVEKPVSAPMESIL